MEILVVGAGAMGRWFAGAVNAAVAFTDADPETAVEAADDLGGRTVPLDADETFDAVCIAVPISAAEAAIADHAERAERAILDVTGVMSDPVAAMEKNAPNVERASLHPLFAPGNAPGNVAVVLDVDGPVIAAILDDIAAAGNELVETTPEEHDDAMETVQAGTHAAVLAFALATDDVPDGLRTPVYDGLDRLVDQVTGDDPRVYAEIQERFDGADAVADAARRLADADLPETEALYREASERRSSNGVDDQ
ncbi:prephenate dehydrogenase/arogenate dehydrogenase family protein [Halostella pelagica]|uniref:prephenate dehydrogenase/arogenate dehydrogenase family protein n=1 Tax=Halostella pelagica TaxID=2583824 RepID=UPI001080CEB4|nr:prephenate dehydrogenase/arogenate dehydrogenase family protein [Halostella pelagica]